MKTTTLTPCLALLAALFLQCGGLVPAETPSRTPTPILPTAVPSPTSTSTPESSVSFDDLEYLACVGSVAEESRDLLLDMSNTASTGNPVSFCASQPIWAERAAAAHTKHAGCRFPDNENLRKAYDYINQALTEMVDGVDCCRRFCEDLSDTYWAQRVVEHMERAGVYLSLGNEEMEAAVP